MAEVKSVKELLNMNLCIPPYQRPYKWDIQNINDLLTDIKTAIANYRKYGDYFKYRIGTIILHEDKGKYNIVDGQQRIISLILLSLCLNISIKQGLIDTRFNSKISQFNIKNNYNHIKDHISLLDKNDFDAFVTAFDNLLEVVVISVLDISEAFQMFDSQNTRGKALDPHDLLKAYHLREMKAYPYEMEHAVNKWEDNRTSDIKALFDLYLYPIWNWSKRYKTKEFTAKEIGTYKGISEESEYTYAKRAGKAMPYFQITEPFVAGNDFFQMVEHYLLMSGDLKREINNNSKFNEINEILNKRESSTGFSYARNLFYCALFCYYDKFHNLDELAIKKLFIWSFMIRIDMEKLGFDSINKYAIGDADSDYTNVIPMFSKIFTSRLHSEISSIQIKIEKKDKPNDYKWEWLLKELLKISGKE